MDYHHQLVAGGGSFGGVDAPIFSLDDTFRAFQPSNTFAIGPFTTGIPTRSAPTGSGAIADADGAESDATSVDAADGHGVPSQADSDAAAPLNANRNKGRSWNSVVFDAASAGPVTLDVAGRPDLNQAPPNWREPDVDHGGHAHWPWRPREDDAGTTGLDELLGALQRQQQQQQQQQASADGESTVPPAAQQLASKLPDVVCGADELKDLLMAPFAQTPLNLLVHRVGESLLIESAGKFDVPGTGSSYTSNTADNRRKSLASKLLYYSILAESEAPLPLAATESAAAAGGRGMKHAASAASSHDEATTLVAKASPLLQSPADAASVPNLVAPQLSNLSPPSAATAMSTPPGRGGSTTTSPPPAADGGSKQQPPFFRRALQWKFDDLSLLLGVRTPLVRDPATSTEMSLQVHDSKRYISQLQALDFWLDNVMNSVASVAVCFHVDGVVQGYRVVPTEDLPGMGVPPFNPVAVKQHASNVLKWLRSSCDRDGGSYILVKGPGGESDMRLYDLADLHAQADQQKQEQERQGAGGTPPEEVGRASMPASCGGLPALSLPMNALTLGRDRPAASARQKRKAATSQRPLDMLDGDDDADGVAAGSNTNNKSMVLYSPQTASSGDDGVATPHGGCRVPDHKDTEALVMTAADASHAFDHPIALMCFRMAQCLAPTDAEAHRLHQKALALLGASELGTALVRGVAHAACAQHLVAESPLADAETMAIEHARLAVRDLAVVVTADTTAQFHPAAHGDAPLKSALATGFTLARLLCGMAVRRVAEKRWVDTAAPLVTAQAFLSLFGEHIPTALLTDGSVSAADAAPPSSPPAVTGGKKSGGGGGRKVRGSTATPTTTAAAARTRTGPVSALPTAPADAFRQELLAAVASVESIAADLIRSVMEDLGPAEALARTASNVHSTSTSLERDAYEEKRRDIRRVQIAFERETVDVMTLVARAQAETTAAGRGHSAGFVPVQTYDEALASLPENITVLRALGAMEATGESLFDASLVTYQSALGHMPSTPAGDRSAIDVRRRIAKLHASRAAAEGEVASSCTQALQRLRQSRSSDAAAAVPSAGSFESTEAAVLAAAIDGSVEAAMRRFEEAQLLFEAVADHAMVLRMALQRSSLLRHTAVLAAAPNGELNAAELASLNEACRVMQGAVDFVQKSSGNAPNSTTAAPKQVSDDLWRVVTRTVTEGCLITASRVASMLATASAPERAPFDSRCIPAGPLLGAGDAKQQKLLSLSELEALIMTKYLLPAMKAAKASGVLQADLQATDTLADVRRAFCGVPPIQGIQGLRPTAVSPALARLIDGRPDARRADDCMVAAVTYLTAQRLHVLSGASHLAIAVASVMAVDCLLTALGLWANVAKQPSRTGGGGSGGNNNKQALLERRVDAVEKALGALHGLRPAMDEAASGAADAVIVEWTIARLSAVLLTVLQLQRETGAATDGGVKALYVSALQAAKDADPKAVAAVLEGVPLVVRNFQAKGKPPLRAK